MQRQTISLQEPDQPTHSPPPSSPLTSAIMCHFTAPKHPLCGHSAHGTAFESSRLSSCPKSKSKDKGKPCSTKTWKPIDVARANCDRCILHGASQARKQGLDPSVYCQRMGVEYVELVEANPGVFAKADGSGLLLLLPDSKTTLVPPALEDKGVKYATAPATARYAETTPVSSPGCLRR